ncbi:uncharacterized protein LOC114259333 [Camellia sinensis]|uniref:uncharacterized protein LOC114259333 n=1 Tax=Camellia sinensis TaxID=4442 RepID=UPI001036BE8C|nr:uncharacterized protein LOC114259333 [Camellia sinensis]
MPKLLATEKRRCIEFENRLRTRLLFMVDGSMIRDYDHFVESTAHLEMVIRADKESRRGSRQREEEGNSLHHLQLVLKAIVKGEVSHLPVINVGSYNMPRVIAHSFTFASGAEENKLENPNGEVEKKEIAPGENKSAKKKKKKDKSSKEALEQQDEPNGADTTNGTDEAAGTEKAEDTSIDVKEKVKKVASMKKKKSSKEMDAAARAAANEAAARNAKLAAAKKKVKDHYNQQPVR